MPENEFVWADVLNRGVEMFGEYPRGEVEGDLLEQFLSQPNTFVMKMEQIGNDIHKGKPIRSGWAVLRAALKRSGQTVVASDYHERERAERAARSLICNAGLYYDKPEQVEEELFTGSGILNRWSADDALRRQMIEFWLEQRPLGIQQEAESLAYQQKVYHAEA